MTEPKPTKLPLLRSESPEEFLALRKRVYERVKPQGVIEEHDVDDVVALLWDLKRQSNLKIGTIQLAYGPALRNLLGQLLSNPRDVQSKAISDNKARVLAKGWLEKDPAALNEVTDILRRFDLDGVAIEAEATKLCADHLQFFDRSIATASARLDKALKRLDAGFANRLRQASDEVLNEPQPVEPRDSGDGEQKAAA